MKGYLPVIAAFVLGVLAEYVNYLITRKALAGRGNAHAIIPLRTLVTGGFIALLFLCGRAFGLELGPLLIAGAAGATAGLIVFTLILLRKKGGENDG